MNFIGNETKQKLRGGYYTPLDLAIFLSRWVKEVSPRTILEPSCGDGVFFNAFNVIDNKDCKIIGFEIDKEEASKARYKANKFLPNSKIYNRDFLEWANSHMKKEGFFDAVVGNPPFIRYQYLPEPFQAQSEQIFENLKLPFTKHTNAWVPFVLASISLLRPGGRLAMILPSEIIHIPYAQPVRTFLGKECRRLVIVDPEKIWFDNTLQGVVILLAEKRTSSLDKAEGLGMYPVRNREFLNLDPEKVFLSPQSINGKTVEGKWTRALLDKTTLKLLDEVSENDHVFRFKDIAKVDVGIVTGANDYFLVTDKVVEEFNLSKWSHPMFGRSEHCPGIIYDRKQHKTNARVGKPTNFIWFPKDAKINDPNVRKYIAYGEKQKLHTRYKCRIRKPWYSVPSVYSSEIGMLKRAHDIPRLILNQAKAYTTDTAYRITSQIQPEKLVGSFINSLTALSAELEGRYYGGGVLELVPSEIENLLIPIPKGISFDLTTIDLSIRNMSPDKILEKYSHKSLGKLGLKNSEQEQLLAAWQKLRNRRQRIPSSLS